MDSDVRTSSIDERATSAMSTSDSSHPAAATELRERRGPGPTAAIAVAAGSRATTRSGKSSLRTVLLLVRHAEQKTMLEIDPELSPRGHEQARLLAQRLAQVPIDVVVASPLVRAQQTAAATAAALGIEVRTHADLDEVRVDAGSLFDTFAGAKAREMEPGPDDYVRAAMAAVEVVPRITWGRRGGETGDQLRERATRALDDVVAAHSGRVVAVFAHGGFINAALGAWLGIARDMWVVPWHTSVSTVVVTPTDKVVIGVNDAGHLGQDEPLLLVSRHLERA